MRKNPKLALLFLAILIPILSGAENISLATAQEVAEKFFIKSGRATRAGYNLTLVNKDDVTGTRAGEQAPFYIFNNSEGGFVIIGGTDAACPVLGYSLDRSFSMEGMPDNLSGWLDMYRGQINERRASGIATTAEEKARWNEALAVTRAEAPQPVVYMKTPEFEQGYPFNKLLPLDTDGKSPVSSCVTICAAQLMAYYKHPKHGTGVLESYETSHGVVVPGVTLGHEYEWDKILDKYEEGKYTEEQANAIARLVYDLVVMGTVELSSSSSTGNTNLTLPALREYMGYDKGLLRFGKWKMDDANWKKILTDALDAREPVPLSASSPYTGGGHAFIIDGYDNMDGFHLNFGWAGRDNGYYKISAFGRYTKEQLAYIHLVPDKGNDYDHNLSINGATSGGTVYKGVMIQKTVTLKKDSPMTIKFGAIYNYGFEPFTGELTFVQKDRNGNIKGHMIQSPVKIPKLEKAGTYSYTAGITLTIPAEIERGDYLEPMFRATGKTEWKSFYNATNPTDTIIGIVPLHLRDYTKVNYNKSTKTLTVSTFNGSSYEVTAADGTTKASGKAGTSGFTLKMSAYSKGTYKLSVKNGDQTMSFNIIL